MLIDLVFIGFLILANGFFAASEMAVVSSSSVRLQTLAEGANLSDIMDQLVTAWRTGDIAYMEETLLAEIADYPELYEAIVADRNRNWVNTIDKLLRDEEDYLVIVGALHLIGKDGMPQLLEARGYKVSQMHETQQ